jgi:hypothetical protein
LILALNSARALAQEPTPAPPAAPEPAPSEQAPAAPAPSHPGTETTSAASPDPAAGVEALRADLQETKARLAELEARQEEAEAEAAVSEEVLLPEPLKIYGFADVGAQHHWIDDSSLVANLLDTRGPSFVIGNLNLYFDAQPIKDWRALVEIRFTNAPQGLVTNYGGLAGTYERVDTKQNDPHAAQLNAPMWRGSTVIERAWIEWNRLQPLKVRVGNWFTPFGIWNEDHGTPTLISLALPQFMLQGWMPVRQTGVMAYGNTFSGEWELGYAATFSNGRQELSNFNFDGKFGFGGRLYARRDTGRFNSAFGVSFFTGKTSDEVVNVTGIAPASFETEVPWEYNEYVMGADASVDIGDTRIRAEGIARRVIYTEGKRPPGDQVFGPGSYAPDKWEYSGYLLVAQQLPWLGLEPFLWGEVLQTPTIVGDGIFVASAGLNVHFNSAITWKTQVLQAKFFDFLYDSPYDNSINDITSVYSRLVMAF